MALNKDLGINVVLDSSFTKGIWYDMVLTSELQSRMFVPLRTHLSLEELEGLPDYVEGTIGYVVYYVETYIEKLIIPHQFYPFGRNPKEQYPFLLGKGIADIIQLFIAEDLLKNNGSSFIIFHRDVSEPRRAQLERIGIEVGRKYHLDEYVERIGSNVSVW